MVRNNIVMHRLDTPKKVTLPKGRTFYSKYECIKANVLWPNIKIQRNYTARRRGGGRRGKKQ